MFGIDLTEFILIFVLAMIMFGPEKLPEYSRKAARLFVYFRDIANNAKTTLRTELGLTRRGAREDAVLRASVRRILGPDASDATDTSDASDATDA